MGLNTVREICAKAPLAIDEFTVNYLAEFKTYKERNVTGAARALINLYRDINPDILDKKHRGRFDMLDKKEDRKPLIYGELQVHQRLDGADLLPQKSSVPIEYDEILDDDDFKRIRVLKRRKLEDKLTNVEKRNMLDHSKKEKNEDFLEIDGDENDDEDDEDFDIGDDVLSDEEELDGEDGNEEWVDEADGGEDEGEESEGEGDKGEMEEENKNKKKVSFAEKPSENNKSNKKVDEEMVIESSEEGEESEDENPHGFVDVSKIARFKKSKGERRKEEQEQAKKLKERTYHGPKAKKGGSTNEEKK